MLKIGLIGTGYIGKVHAECWSKMENAVLHAVCDSNREKASQFGAEYGAAAFENVTEFIDSGIDVIDICVPTPFHMELAEQAAKRKISVLCEKPIASNLGDAEKMIKLFEKNTAMLMIAHCVRFDPCYAYLKKIVEERTYGELTSLRIYRNSAVPKYSEGQWLLNKEVSGGVAMDLHIHDVDIIYWLLKKPDWVFSSANDGRIASTYGYSGKSVSSEASWRTQTSYPFNAGYDAQFEKGSVLYTDWKLQLFLDDGCRIVDNVVDVLESDIIKTNDAYLNEIKYFVKCLESNAAPTYCLPQDSLFAHQVLLAELESARKCEINTLN